MMTYPTSDHRMTLQDALEAHRLEEDPDGTITAGMLETSAQAFTMHDAVHLEPFQ